MSDLQCPENKVPGWLDESGQPQGCVDNNPTPGIGKIEEVPEQTTEVPAQTVAVQAHPTELAVTGGSSLESFGAVMLGGLLFLGALILVADFMIRRFR